MLEIYCDGAYSSSRDTGGWAIVVLKDGEKIYSNFYPIKGGTNNTAEIQAAIEACGWIKETTNSEATIYTDSMYVVGTMTRNWKRNKNNDLWEVLDQTKKDLKIKWQHVKGHEGNKYNELCDYLAKQATFVT